MASDLKERKEFLLQFLFIALWYLASFKKTLKIFLPVCAVYTYICTCIIYPEEVCTAWSKQLNCWHVTEADQMLRFGLEMRIQTMSLYGLLLLQVDSVVDVGTAAYAQLQKIKGRSLDGVENSGNRRTVSFFLRI